MYLFFFFLNTHFIFIHIIISIISHFIQMHYRQYCFLLKRAQVNKLMFSTLAIYCNLILVKRDKRRNYSQEQPETFKITQNKKHINVKRYRFIAIFM